MIRGLFPVHHKSSDLIAVLGVTIAGLVVRLCGISGGVLALLTLPLVLVCPGYALAAAVFPAGSLGRVERGVLSLGLSMALTALGGFVLDATTWGMTPQSWTVLLGGLTVIAGAGALMRRAQQPVAIVRPIGRLSTHSGLLLVLAAALVVAAATVARVGADRQTPTRFTQLAILPGADSSRSSVRLSVRSLEAEEMKYTLKVEVGGLVVHEWSPIDLAPGEQWEGTADLPIGQAGPVEARLYRLNAPTNVYRWVTLSPTEQEK